MAYSRVTPKMAYNRLTPRIAYRRVTPRMAYRRVTTKVDMPENLHLSNNIQEKNWLFTSKRKILSTIYPSNFKNPEWLCIKFVPVFQIRSVVVGTFPWNTKLSIKLAVRD